MHPRQQSFQPQRQWWRILHPRQQFFKRQRQLWRILPAPAVLRVGGLQGSVPGQSSTSRRGHDLPLPSGWRRAEDASGRVYYWHVHTRQTRWTPPVTGFEDENEEDEEDEEDEDEEDEDMDEIYAESRFPAGFLPMRTAGRCGGACSLTV